MVIKVGVGAMSLGGGFPEPKAVKLTLENFLAGNRSLAPLQHSAETLQGFFSEVMQKPVSEGVASTIAALHEVTKDAGWAEAHGAAVGTFGKVKEEARSLVSPNRFMFDTLKMGLENGAGAHSAQQIIHTLGDDHADMLSPLNTYLERYGNAYEAMRNIAPKLLQEAETIAPAAYVEGHGTEVKTLTQSLLTAVEKAACPVANCPDCKVDAANHMGFLKGVNRPMIIGGLAVAAAAAAAGAYYVHQVGKKAHAEEAVQPCEPQR
jgi:hypothetical protein